MNISTRQKCLTLLIGAVLTLLIVTDSWPLLRGPSEWQWPLAEWPVLPALFWSATAVILFLALWFIAGRRLNGKRPFAALLTLTAGALIMQFGLLRLAADDPAALQFERLASNQASGYFTVAQEIDHLPTFLREFPARMPYFAPDPHPRSKPPGIILLNWALMQLLARLPALATPLGHLARGIRCADLWLAARPNHALAANWLMGLLTPLASALTVWPAYGLAARWRGPRAGWLAAGLVALVPGRLLFTPHMDTVYPLLTLLSLYLAERGVADERPSLTFLAGLVISAATFFSLVNGLIALLVGLFVLARFGGRDGRLLPAKESLLPLLRHGAALTGGALALWLIYWLAAGVMPLAIYRAAAPARHDLSRSYWLWLAGNVADFALFSGAPLFLLALPRRLKISSPAAALAAAFWLLFLLLDLSGAIRGEVGRIWLMLAPVPALLAAAQIAFPNARSRFDGWLMLTLAALAWSMAARWQATLLEWPPTEEREIVTAVPAIEHPQTTAFGADIRLLGFDQSPVRPTTITLYWQAVNRPDVAYTVFLHVVDENGGLVAQDDRMPQDGRLPTTCWQPGEVIADPHIATIPDDGKSYRVLVGLYDGHTGLRLANGAPDDALPLEP